MIFILSSLCILGKAIHDLATKLLPEVVRPGAAFTAPRDGAAKQISAATSCRRHGGGGAQNLIYAAEIWIKASAIWARLFVIHLTLKLSIWFLKPSRLAALHEGGAIPAVS